MLKRSRVLLALGGVVLMGYGVAFLIHPPLLGVLTGLEFGKPDAYTEVRAFYGGLEFGIALYLLYCARRPEFIRGGLLFCFLAFLAAGLARFAGLVQYGATDPAQAVAGGLELAFALFALHCAGKEARSVVGGPRSQK